MRIYMKNNPGNFQPNPIWNDGALGFFEEHYHNENNKNNVTSSTMRSVSIPEMF